MDSQDQAFVPLAKCHKLTLLSSSLFLEKAASLAPWFPAHLQRDIYFSLLHLEPSQSEKKTPNVPESVLKAALLRRATEDIRRVMALRSQKQALSVLLQRGSVGDDLWQRFMRAEKEMEEEVRDVVSEVSFYPLLFYPVYWDFPVARVTGIYTT